MDVRKSAVIALAIVSLLVTNQKASLETIDTAFSLWMTIFTLLNSADNRLQIQGTINFVVIV